MVLGPEFFFKKKLIAYLLNKRLDFGKHSNK